jgi:UDP-GlcNAc3NAcA epimerase
MILTVIGARPQFVKAAVISKQLMAVGIKEVIVHTGQHYDEKMSQIFWDQLNIPKPEFNLNVGSGSQGYQTAQMMIELEKIILNELPVKPAAVLLYGDTNSTLSGALVASKLNIPIIHIESGLRSYNREMPEEINRVVTDHLSELLFCPTTHSQNQLMKEGVEKNVYVSGDVMYDCFLLFSEIARQTVSIDNYLTNGRNFGILTLHRPSNTDDFNVLQKIINEIGEMGIDILWPMHPRNRQNIEKLIVPKSVKIIEPLSYFEMLLMLEKCECVLTDSGGLQKEAYWAKKRCITLRSETEWVETLEGNWNQVCDPLKDDIFEKYNNKPNLPWKALYGSGNSSEYIVDIIQKKLFL